MNRILFSGMKKCKNGCKYCFSNWSEYKKQTPLFESEMLENIDVIYPTCDSEILDEVEYLKVIKKIFEINPNIIISISTKSLVSEKFVEKINIINSDNDRKGFVKLSVSFTNKYNIKSLEPKAANYDERLKNLAVFKSYKIPLSVNIKPILPFVENSEYYEIINDTMQYTDLYLLGSLYVSKNTNFFKNYISEVYNTEKKVVKWLYYEPLWEVVQSKEKIGIIRHHIQYIGKKALDSDLEVIACLKG